MRSSLSRSGLLLLLDILGLFGAYNLAHKLRLGEWISFESDYLRILIVLGVVVFYIMDMYRIRESDTTTQYSLNTFAAILVVAVASVITAYAIGIEKFTPIFGRGVLPVAMLLFALWAPFWRWIFTRWLQQNYQISNWLLVGGELTFANFNEENSPIYKKLNTRRIDANSDGQDIGDWFNEFPDKSGVIIESNARLSQGVLNHLKFVSTSSIPILTVAEYYERYWMKLPVLKLENSWYIQNRGMNLLHDRIGIRLKRVTDIVFAVVGLVIASPLILIISLLVYFNSPGGVIFKQHRVGLNGKVFTLYKFRSMIKDAEQIGPQWSREGDDRINNVGKILRATRLDELPQFWNLILGDMSLIGPRPERPEFIEQLAKEIPLYDMRHQVPPGLTGWAQVMYGYGSSVKDSRNKLEYDLYYIKNHSITLDLMIVLKTVIVILRGGGR